MPAFVITNIPTKIVSYVPLTHEMRVILLWYVVYGMLFDNMHAHNMWIFGRWVICQHQTYCTRHIYRHVICCVYADILYVFIYLKSMIPFRVYSCLMRNLSWTVHVHFDTILFKYEQSQSLATIHMLLSICVVLSLLMLS